MGTIAARDALRVLELCEQVAAACLMSATQGIRLRQRAGEVTAAMLGDRLAKFLAAAGTIVPVLNGDTPLDAALASITAAIRQGSVELEIDTP